MSLATTAEAAARLPRHRLWAISAYPTADGEVDLAVSHDDLARDVAWVGAALAEHGAGRGHVLAVSGGWEAPWFWPFAAATIEAGGRYSATEIWPFDARRTALFLRRLPIDAVVGIDTAVVTALAGLVDLAEAFAGVRVVLARPGAVQLLAEAGVAAHAVAPVGPAIAIEGPERDGLRVDGASWSFGSDGDHLHVTTVGPRAHRIERLLLDVAGTVDGDRLRLEADEP